MVKLTTGEFIKGITSDDIAQVVLQSFDELMVLYHIVGSRQDVEICIENGSNPVSFILMMESHEEASNLANTMNGLDFDVYGVRYIINMICRGNSIQTNIRKA